MKQGLIELAVWTSNRVLPHFPVLRRALLSTVESHGSVRSLIAAEYLQGCGIEIGALHARLTVPAGAQVRYVDRFPTELLKAQYPELPQHEFVDVDIVDNGEHLAKIENKSQDFVIANHFVEHCQDPITAIGNMVRVLREEGILYFALPDKRFTFDIERPVTTVEHILSDYHNGPAGSLRDHLDEWYRVVEKVEDRGERNQAVEKALQSEDHIHYHVWTQTGMLELIVMLQRMFPLELELVKKHGIEVIIVMRKREVDVHGTGVVRS